MDKIGTLYRWWIAEIFGARFSSGSARAGSIVRIDLAGGRIIAPDGHVIAIEASLENLRDDLSPVLKRFPRAALAVRPATVFQKTLVLPSVSERSLQETIRYDIDRQTPFKAGDVKFTCRVIGRNIADKTISVALTLAPQETIKTIQEIGNHLVRKIVYIGADIETLQDNLLENKARPDKKDFRMALAALLIVLVFIIPLAEKYRQASDLDIRLAAVRKATEEEKTSLNAATAPFIWTETIHKQERVLDALNDIALSLDGNGEIARIVWERSNGGLSGELSGTAINTSDFVRRLSGQKSIESIEYLAPTEKLDNGHERFSLSIVYKGVQP